MKTLEELIAAAKDALAKYEEASNALADAVAAAEGVEDDEAASEAERSISEASQKLKRAKHALEVAENEVDRRTATDAIELMEKRSSSLKVEVVSEANVYAGSGGFLKDLYTLQKGGGDEQQRAFERLKESTAQSIDCLQKRGAVDKGKSYRDLTTTATDGGDFVPPFQMLDDFIGTPLEPTVTAGLFVQPPMTEFGISIDIPAVSTGASAAAQVDAASVSETDPVTTTNSSPVASIVGQVDMSRTLFERSAPHVDSMVSYELLNAHNITLDTQVLSGTGLNSQMTGLAAVSGSIAVTYTDASPTVAELYPKLADAKQQVHTNTKATAKAIVVHPRRLGFLEAAVDSTGRPLFIPYAMAAQNSIGQVSSSLQNVAEPVGRLIGLDVYVDPNITIVAGAGTNEDKILILNTSDIWLFRSIPTIRPLMTEVLSGTDQVRMQVQSYAALMTRRAKSIAIIGGTGLVTPTF